MQDKPAFDLEELNLTLEGKNLDAYQLEVGMKCYRARVPGGWLVVLWRSGLGLTFYPDPSHKWDGGTQQS
jgi:hypothetical protein